MLRFLISIVFLLLSMRLIASIVRMLTPGRSRPELDPKMRVDPLPKSDIDPSTAVDVPFTEIPPETPR